MTPRFLVDRGSATLSAALVAPVDGKWRLVDAAAFPASVDLEAALAFLAGDAAGLGDALPELVGAVERWPEWERIEAVTVPPRRIAVAAPTARRLADLEAAAGQAGWRIGARITPEHADELALSTLLANPRLDALALAAGDPPTSEERRALLHLAAIAGAMASRRDDLTVVLCGAAIEEAESFPVERTVLAPAPAAAGGATHGHGLARLFMELGGQPEGARLAAAKTIATLAAVLERSIEFVDVGASGGAWFRVDAVPPMEREAGPAGPPRTDDLEGFVLAAASIIPEGTAEDDVGLDEIIAWSALRVDRPSHQDLLRDLRAHPWREAGGAGALLRVAAGRAALARLEAERLRLGGASQERTAAPDLLVVGGGAFALAPGPAIALAVMDTLRRPGMMQLAYDHARLLGPLGVLDEHERRRLVADLLDDLLLPLGSALMVEDGHPGREVARLRVASDGLASETHALVGGTLRLVELAPGSAADVELELPQSRLGRMRARRIGLQATGGLGGLLIDARGVPLRLPQRTERRREVLGQWQRSLWPGAE